MCQWKRETENRRRKRIGATIFAFYISVINTKLYKVLIGFFSENFQKRIELENFKHINKK